MTQPWLILDMDDGVIRREPTRRAAVAWMIDSRTDRQVISRHRFQAGDYEYHIGNPGDEESHFAYFVERLDVAIREGWGDWFEIPDMYPYPERPHDQNWDIDRDALIKAWRRRQRDAA